MPDLTPLLYALVAIVGIVVLGSFLVAAFAFKGKTRIAVLSAIAAGWIVLYVQKIHKPTELTVAAQAWRGGAVRRCQQELPQLPARFNVDGFVDEGGAMRKRVILQLFAERRLRFIEIRPRRTDGQVHIGYPDGDQEGVWSSPDLGAPYIRIELSAYPDPRCTKLPVGLDERIGRPPFLPETCVAAITQDAPTADLALTLNPADASNLGKYGSWQLVDRRTGNRLASLTTVNSAETWIQSRGGPLSTARHRVNPDCRAPYTELVDKIYGTETSTLASMPQVLAEERVESSTDVLQIAPTDAKRDVQPTSEEFLYTDEESWALFTPEIRHREWQSIVDQSRVSGIAAYGSRILDWKQRRLVSLSVTRKENPYPWHALASGDGFFVFSTSPAWQERPSNLLLRYRRDGSLAWVVNVVTPTKNGRPCNFWPQAIYVEGKHLVLADRCSKLSDDEARATGKSARGEKWSIALHDLPSLD